MSQHKVLHLSNLSNASLWQHVIYTASVESNDQGNSHHSDSPQVLMRHMDADDRVLHVLPCCHLSAVWWRWTQPATVLGASSIPPPRYQHIYSIMVHFQVFRSSHQLDGSVMQNLNMSRWRLLANRTVIWKEPMNPLFNRWTVYHFLQIIASRRKVHSADDCLITKDKGQIDCYEGTMDSSY